MCNEGSLEFVDLVPMYLAFNCFDILNSIKCMDSEKIFQQVGCSVGSFSIDDLSSIINLYYYCGVLTGGLNQFCMLKKYFKEEIEKYLKRHSEYFQYDYEMMDFLARTNGNKVYNNPWYRVIFTKDCSSNFQYLFDVINKLSEEIRWNRSEYFMSISHLPFVCEYKKIDYNDETKEIVLESSRDLSRNIIYKQQK